jgi:hypothetical protein
MTCQPHENPIWNIFFELYAGKARCPGEEAAGFLQ